MIYLFIANRNNDIHDKYIVYLHIFGSFLKIIKNKISQIL
jgi:hypothetical protein